MKGHSFSSDIFLNANVSSVCVTNFVEEETALCVRKTNDQKRKMYVLWMYLSSAVFCLKLCLW
jgi:hypothetical protein